MSSASKSIGEVATQPLPRAGTSVPRRYNVWPAVLVVVIYWATFWVLALLPLGMFSRFLWQMGALGGLILAFSIWWLTLRAIRWRERWLVLGLSIAGAIIATLLLHRTVVPPSLLMLALPALLTVWTLWLVAAQWLTDRARLLGLVAIPVLTWTPMTLVRMEGLSGEGQPVLRWRWSQSREDEFLASTTPKSSTAARESTSVPRGLALETSADDWPGFRGQERDGVVHGVRIATDWNESPPKLLWQKLVGPAWSSMVIVGNRLFTQEQRGQTEVVVCVDGDSGDEVWVHEDAGRFEENLGGIGPRATPTFAESKIYSLGAAGALNCLDAATGKKQWGRNIATDSGAKVPMWGFSGSPLFTSGLVVVFAGGDDDSGLLAYRADTGEPAWKVAAGHHSYSSPHIAFVGGAEQIMFVSDVAITSVEPSTGRILWSYDRPDKFGQPSLQPHVASDSDVLVSFNPDTGTTSLRVSHDAEGWRAEPKWISKTLKPFFNDFVRHGDSLYGFDGNIFCCLDLESGNRRWKSGRYGNGQTLLIADQAVLLVISESGEAVLIAANPHKHVELGRFQAVRGKTWNHPVVAKNRLYVRNAEEMACYQLTPL